MNWYESIRNDWNKIVDYVEYCNSEIKDAKQDIKVKDGRRIEQHCAELPGIVEHRYGQLQEVEAILEYFNVELRKEKSKQFKQYLENYNRDLKSRDVEKYVDGEASVVDLCLIINEIALIRNKFLGIHKAIEQKSWMLSHITKLRTAGIDDATL